MFSRERFTTVTAYRGFVTKSQLLETLFTRNLLRSTKWNANIILLRDYAELVALCKVIVWKTHIPVRTQKWPLLLIFAGARHGIVINHVTA